MTEDMILIASLTLITGGFALVWLPLGPLALGFLLLSFLIWGRLSRR